MSRFAYKIQNMSDNAFIRKYVMSRHKNITISEKRNIIKNTLYDRSAKFYVEFEYVIVKKSFFGNTYIANKVIRDKVYFIHKDDASFYVDNVLFPSIPYRSTDYLSQQIVFKEFKNDDRFIIYAKKEYSHSDIEFVCKTNSHYADYSWNNMAKDAYAWVKRRYADSYPIKVDTILSVTVNDLFNIKQTDLDKIKQNIDETNDITKTIIVNEIERTTEYLEILKKFL